MTELAPIAAELSRSMRNHLIIGSGALALMIGGVGSWIAMTEIAGAVIAPGVLVVDGNAKKVQHPTGGVVAGLLVREGQLLMAGDTIIRLDATVTRANLAAVSKKLSQFHVRRARLQAERDGLTDVAVPSELLARLSETDIDAAMAGERRLFDDRRTSREGQKARLREQSGQLREQIVGLDVQQQAKAAEITLIGRELEGQRDLFKKGLTPLNRLNNLERDSMRLSGERGQLIASIASAKGRIAEIELQILQIDQAMRTEVSGELRDIEAQLAELAEQETVALDQLTRVEIKAPISGTVHRLSVHTVGGVITPAETLMEIVPQGSELTVESRIPPQDIDQLIIGQDATLHFTAFNRNTTPALNGRLTRISADLEADEKTGVTYYRAAISIPPTELNRIPGLALVPGMPVDSFIRLGDRTVLSYLIKPLKDHASRMFRDE